MDKVSSAKKRLPLKRFYNMGSRFQGDDRGAKERRGKKKRGKERENKSVARYCFLEWYSLVQCSPALVDRYQMYPDRLVSTVIPRHAIPDDYVPSLPNIFAILPTRCYVLFIYITK